MSVWAEDGLPEGQTSAVVRLEGRRVDGERRPGPQDRFVRDEPVTLPPGSGPFSLTARVTGINPGEWQVTAEMRPARPDRAPARGVRPKPVPLPVVTWTWRHWRQPPGPAERLRTGPAVFARRPGLVPGGWAALVALGILAALVLQANLAAGRGMPVGSTLVVSAAAVLAGGVGAKAWYLLLERRTGRWDGWAVQGFVAGLLLVAVLVVPLFDLSVGRYLDVTAPALLLGMAIGRLGCFVAGCCGGRATCSRGIWSSDRRIGVKRVPTQLAESAVAFAVAIGSYIVLENVEPNIHGSLFVAAVAVYTLCRQVVLRYRAEARHTTTGSRMTAAAALIALTLGLAGIWS